MRLRPGGMPPPNIAAVPREPSRSPAERRAALLHAQRRAPRRSDRRLGREARLPVAAADLDDPLPRLQQPAPARPWSDQERGGKQLVLRAGRWVPGEGWTPLAPTPASPGWASGDSAFASAAGEVLTALTGHSFAGRGHSRCDAGRRQRHRALRRRGGGPHDRHEGRRARAAKARRLTCLRPCSSGSRHPPQAP